jgi:hypothetical protein
MPESWLAELADATIVKLQQEVAELTQARADLIAEVERLTREKATLVTRLMAAQGHEQRGIARSDHLAVATRAIQAVWKRGAVDSDMATAVMHIIEHLKKGTP